MSPRVRACVRAQLPTRRVAHGKLDLWDDISVLRAGVLALERRPRAAARLVLDAQLGRSRYYLHLHDDRIVVGRHVQPEILRSKLIRGGGRPKVAARVVLGAKLTAVGAVLLKPSE